MTLHVQYKSGTYDYVQNRTLDRLIEEDAILQFYRPSEKRWVDVETDPVRGKIRLFSIEQQRWVNISINSLKTPRPAYTGIERRADRVAA